MTSPHPHSHNNSAFTRWMRYADNGNITWKRDKGWYCYDTARPHAVSGIRQTETGDCNNTWQYDNWGNMTDDGARTIEYSDFDKATSVTVTATGDTTTFAYGTDRSRYKREDTTADGTTRTLYFGSQERVYRQENSVCVLEKTRRNLPGAIQTLHATTGVAETFYQHRDHLGSVNTLTNDRGEIVQKLYFDAWGKKVELPKTSWQWQAQAAAAPTLKDLDAVTPRGFTGHEHLDHADIIHMNGRIYDPTLGRFLQADPHIQAPQNSQSYNRYSYVLNNPLSYTDPSGYFFDKLLRPFKNVIRGAFRFLGQDLSQQLIQFVSSACGPFKPLCSAVLNYDYARAFGASSSGALKAAFTAGVSAYIVNNTEWTDLQKDIAYTAVDFGADVLFGDSDQNQQQASGSGDKVSIHSSITQANTADGSVSSVTGGKFANGSASKTFGKMYTSSSQNTCSEASCNEDQNDENSNTNKLVKALSVIGQSIEDFFSWSWLTERHSIPPQEFHVYPSSPASDPGSRRWRIGRVEDLSTGEWFDLYKYQDGGHYLIGRYGHGLSVYFDEWGFLRRGGPVIFTGNGNPNIQK